MAKLTDFIRSTKSEIDEGRWRSGHIERSAFPLSKTKAKHYKFGPTYHWRVVRFRCLGAKCRVLIQLNLEKWICRSTFAVERDNDLVVLCTHEYHATHPGWHCHLDLEDVKDLESGVFRTGKRRWPVVGAEHAKKEFGVSEASALAHVAQRYGFAAQGDLL